MSGVRLCLIACLGLSVSACKATPNERPAELDQPQNEPVEPSPPAAAVKAADPAPAADGSETPSATELPVAEDFQAETTAAIVRSNYRRELDDLETEMRADGE